MPPLRFTSPRDLNNTPVPDPLSMYKISDMDVSGDPKYYLNLAHNGSFYIMKENTTDPAATTYRYYAGFGDYLTAWANRASLPYNYFDLIF